MAGGEHSVRPRGAAQPAVLANSARRGTNAVAYCGQNPPRQGRGALTRARSSGGLVISRPPGRHTGSVPRGSLLHCLDSIEDTRARHDAPSPRPVRHRDRAPGWPWRSAPAAGPLPATARGGTPPGGTERATAALIRPRRRTGQPRRHLTIRALETAVSASVDCLWRQAARGGRNHQQCGPSGGGVRRAFRGPGRFRLGDAHRANSLPFAHPRAAAARTTRAITQPAATA